MAAHGEGSVTDSVATLSGTQKVAALLITLGTASAAKLLSRLSPESLDKVATELMTMPGVRSEIRDAILEETYSSLFSHMGELPGGPTYALELFTQAFGESKGSLLLERIHETLVKPPFEFLRPLDPLQAAQLLAGEHPQTIALVLAHLDPRIAAKILIQLEPDQQVDVARRVAL